MDFITQLKEGVLSQMIASFSAFVPKLSAAILVFALGWLIAKGVRSVARRILVGLKIDALADSLNDIEIVQKSGVRVMPSGVIAQTLYYVLMLIFTIAATDVLGVAAITQMVSDILNYLPALFSAGIVFLLGLMASDMIKGVATSALLSLGIPSARMIGNVIFYFLFITVAVSALAQAKINTEFIGANLTIIIGAFALAFAFGYGRASKDVVANYLAGFSNKNKVRVGDEVRILGERGKVVMIDSSSLILQTHDRAIVVPLSKLTTEKVEIFYPEGQDDFLIGSGEKL